MPKSRLKDVAKVYMKLSNYLFIHGGPGFNSFSEQALLSPLFQRTGAQIEFWNEPSKFRPQGFPYSPERSFENLCASIEARLEYYRKNGLQVHLLVHSFGINPISRIFKKYLNVLCGLTVISPASNLQATYNNVVRLGIRLFREENENQSELIENTLKESRKLFDDKFQEAIGMAASYPTLFDHYWYQVQARNESTLAAARKGAEAQFDAESFFSVMSDLTHNHKSTEEVIHLPFPVTAAFGRYDPIIEQQSELLVLQKTFPKVHISIFEKSAHYGHLEEPERLLRLLDLK